MSSLVGTWLRLGELPHGWRRALGVMSILWLATALGAAMSFLAQAILARQLGPARFGLFGSSLATVSMMAPLAGFGLAQFWLKAYGGEGWAASRWLPPSRRFLVVTTSVTLSGLVAWAFTGAPRDSATILLVLLPVVLAVLSVGLLTSKLRLEERHGALALWQLVTPGSRLIVAAMLLVLPALALRFVAVGYGVSALVVVLIAAPELIVMLRGEIRLYGHGLRVAVASQRLESPAMFALWSQAWAFGLSAALYPIFFQIGTVLVKYIDGNARAGVFGIALAVMTAIYLIPATLYQKFLLSKQHRWAVHDPRKFWLVYRRGNLLMLASGLGLGLLMVVLSPWAVPLAFGTKYLPVIPVLRVLAWCIPIRFLSTSVGSALLNERHMRYRVFAMGMGAAVVVVLNLVLIPSLHELGAAAATVAGETVLALALYAGVRRFHPDRNTYF